MTEAQYQSRRHELTVQAMHLRSIHCPLSARARIRKIAELDLEHRGIPKATTFKNFNY